MWARFFKPGFNLPNFITTIAIIAIIVTVARPSSAELSSWVQAIGSIVAIAFAAYLPIRHTEIAVKKRQDSLARILRVIADDAVEALFLLSNAFIRPDRESYQMVKYQSYHKGREWTALIDQLSQIPVADLTPHHARDLSNLKDAVSFGAYVAGLIPQWMQGGGHSRPDVLRVLRGKRDIAALIRSRLPAPEGIFTTKMSYAQQVGSMAELTHPIPEPVSVDEGEIYRRYVWEKDSDIVPAYAVFFGVFTYIEGFGPSIVERLEHWTTYEEADMYFRDMSRVLGSEHVEAAYRDVLRASL